MNDRQRELFLLCQLSDNQLQAIGEVVEELSIACQSDPHSLPSLRVAQRDQEQARRISQACEADLNRALLKGTE
jgi:hypothetical protein